MTIFGRHSESHRAERIGWLRAAVLGANDGIVSTASLIVGVAAAKSDKTEIVISGVAGLVAGALSMAAGEYVSVSSQSDTEKADLARERHELATDPEFETEELAQIYVARGLDLKLAREVAVQLMEKDALKSHARDELQITEMGTARPVQAAIASASTFSVGAVLPLLVVFLVTPEKVIPSVSVSSIGFLILLGIVSARAGGASILKGATRVCFWGAFAMAATALIGKLFGTVVQ
ncbi:MAG: VIT family protein [Proteobacteria bacterium]|nr:VIT family protein [Pseudomonadota bacterium]